MPRLPAALALWSLFVWGVRIRNAAGEVGPTVVAGSFVVLAVAVLVTTGARLPTLALAGWTIAVWLVRAVDIALLSDHEVGFVAVHTVLAAVSIALAVLALRSSSHSHALT
ncbi:MAG TPA: hypothetical protein VFK43_22080 [Acidimicrobiales bacterium]|nr:hypothetical protein [Acidimicrobiales bacterium]